jgi:hypothetical protein
MPRQSVADLLGEVDQAPAVLRPGPAPAEAAPAAAVAAEKPEPRQPAPRRVARGPRDAGTTGVTESQIPKWQRLERKELRLRADQLDELARIRRTLNRQRGGRGRADNGEHAHPGRRRHAPRPCWQAARDCRGRTPEVCYFVTQAPPGAQARAEGARGPGEAAVPARCERRGLPPVTAPSPCCRRCLRARPRHLRTHRLRNNRLRRYGVRKYRLRRQSGRRACGSPAAPEPRAPGRGPGLPKYLRLERKELLIWPDQITNLSILARVLNRNRGERGSG